jgi:phosphatidylinositol glycan class B
MVVLTACDRRERSGLPPNILAAMAGLLFGLAFWCRFQIGLALVGLALWLLLIRRPGARLILVTGGALGAALFFGVLVDRWFYGEWVLTPLRYFDVNLIENRAADWGVQPWWWYFVQLVYQLVPPYSLLLIAGGIVACFRRSRNVLVWVVVSFVLLHLIVGHKEARFLFPLLYALPVLPVLALEGLGSPWREVWDRIWWSRTARVLGYFWVAVNLGGMVVVSLLPANRSAVIQGWLYERGEEAPFTVYTLGRDPYLSAGLRVNFYRSPQVTVRDLASSDQLAAIVRESGDPVYVFYEGLTPPQPAAGHELEFTAETLSLPRWLVDLPVVRRFFLIHLWGVYRCEAA